MNPNRTSGACILAMHDETADDKPADRGSLTCNTPNIAAADQSRRDESQTPGAAPTAGVLGLEVFPLATSQTCDASAAKGVSATDAMETPCHLMKLPAELRLQIYEHHFQNILASTEPKLEKRQTLRGMVSRHVRTLEKAEIINRALSIVHTSHKLRIEALPVGRRLVKSFQDSMEAEFDRVGSCWRQTARQILWSMMQDAAAGVPQKARDPRCHKLELQYDDVCEIRAALQLVKSHRYTKNAKTRKTKCKKYKYGASIETRLMELWGLENDGLQGRFCKPDPRWS